MPDFWSLGASIVGSALGGKSGGGGPSTAVADISGMSINFGSGDASSSLSNGGQTWQIILAALAGAAAVAFFVRR